MIEILRAWPYGAENSYAVPEWPAPLEQVRVEETRIQLEEQGFRSLGVFFDQKGKHYQTRYEFYIDTATSQHLFMIAHGTIMRMPVIGEMVFSIGVGDACYATLTHMALAKREWKRWKYNFAKPSPVARLLALHDAFVAKHGDEKRTIDRDDPMACYRKRRVASVEELAIEKVVHFLDEEKNRYRYTVWGAIKSTLFGYGSGLATAFRLKSSR